MRIGANPIYVVGAVKCWGKPMKSKWSVLPEAIAWKTTLLLERVMGVDYSAIVQPETVGLDGRTAFRSSPSGGHHLRQALGAMQPSPESRILDIGCGKGSAMRTMLDLPFAVVAGLELSPELAGIATNNLRRFPRARIYCGDAVSFPDYGQFDIFYMYNPFPEHVMAQVLERLAALSGRRSVSILYANPTCHALFGVRFKVVRDFPAAHGHVMRLYSSGG